MAGNDCAASLYAVAMRVARLDSTGATPAGATNMYVTNAMAKIDHKPVIQEGEARQTVNAQGLLCVDYQEPDQYRGWDVTIDLCAPDPELIELLAGGTLLTETGNTVGWAAPALRTVPNPNGVSLEFWTRAIIGDAPAASNPYIWWAFPRLWNLKFGDEDRSAGVDPMATQITGRAIENPNWGNGPNNDWTLASTRALQHRRTATIPTPACGYATTPAQV
jgi:hypothetical protein